MADESIWAYGSEITLEESGVALTDSTEFAQADDANLTAANQADFTHADVRLTTVGFATNPVVGGVMNVYLRPINLESAEDAPPPSTNYPHTHLCSVPIDDDQALTQALMKEVKLPYPDEECEGYVQGDAGQDVDSGWNLRITPKALKPAA